MSLKTYMRERGLHFQKVQAPYVSLIIAIGKLYPEPTREGDHRVRHPNSFRLLDIRDKFIEYELNLRKRELICVALKILIVKYEHSMNYRAVFDWFVEMLAKSGWKGRSYGYPRNWNEPQPYGGVKEIIWSP